MKRTWKVIMICSNGKEVVLNRCRSEQKAKTIAKLETKRLAYEVQCGYAETNTRFEARYC